MGSVYLERYAWKERLFPSFTASNELKYIIVIPAFREKKLTYALDSLNRCKAPKGSVLILVVINESENTDLETSETNQSCAKELENYKSKFPILHTYLKLPHKKAGVGLARKIGMDEAVRIFNEINLDGTIICYDADCFCEKNYLVTIEKHFSQPESKAAVIFYEHKLNGEHHDAIADYELYLRYYINALRFAGYPYAHQTLGSCIIVRASHYQTQGGMNTRKAGEDFYFLNKIIPTGGFIEINSTTVYPSDRVSDRVPFGTGKAVGQLLQSEDEFKVYNPKSFEDLKRFISSAELFREDKAVAIPDSISKFLGGNVITEIEQIKKQTTSLSTFTQRFFRWFDAFRILKFIHFARDNYYENIPLTEALQWLEINYTGNAPGGKENKLEKLRSLDRGWTKQDQTGSSHQRNV